VKRVILYRFDRKPVEAIVSPTTYLGESHIELITVGGNLQVAPYSEVKALCFASEPGRDDLFSEHNMFERRPKAAGLWTRFTLRDGDKLDGILPHNLLDWPASGYLITPPRAGANRQLVFIPRAALSGTELRGVVGVSAVSEGIRKRATRSANQLTIFDP
jgi:hypothetical protein